MALSISQIADLITATQKHYGPMGWTDLTGDLTEMVALPRMLREERVKIISGESIERRVMLGDTGAARHVGMYATDSLAAQDQLATISSPWRHTTTSAIFDRVEFKINRDPAQIVDLIQTRRYDMMISLAKLMEQTWWSAPAASTDNVTPYGIPYWVVQNATTGFKGTAPTGHTLVGGLNPTTYARWCNYTADYDDVSLDDLIEKMRRAYRSMQFQSPIPHPDNKRGNHRYVIYANLDTCLLFEQLAESRNDNLGKDLATMDDQTRFRGVDIVYVPYLDADSTDPVYFINWAVFWPYFLKGEYMMEEPPSKVGGQHKVLAIFTDITWNTMCVDRRRNGVIAKVA